MQVLLRDGAGLELVDLGRLERWGPNYIQRIKPKLSHDGSGNKAAQKNRVSGHLIGGALSLKEEGASTHSKATDAEEGVSKRSKTTDAAQE